jgi:hypothetical protein
MEADGTTGQELALDHRRPPGSQGGGRGAEPTVVVDRPAARKEKVVVYRPDGSQAVGKRCRGRSSR